MANILRVEKLHKNFGGLVAVNDVSFEVSEGEIFGIIGPNGAGKTTMFNLITGTIPSTSGAVYFKEHLITGLPVYKIATLGISRTFQTIKLLSGQTLLDNVLLGQHTKIHANFVMSILRTKKEQAEEQRATEFCMEILKKVGLADRWNQTAGSLSYGNQRLLEIARALATEPKLIFLDEPAAGMNSFESSRLMEIICDLRDSGITPIVIEHDMKVIMGICDDIIVLDHGMLICHGNESVVRNDSAVIEAYLGKEVVFDA